MAKFFTVLIIFFSSSIFAIENGVLTSKEQLMKAGTVAIIFESEGKEESVCTGTRISPQIVITAWHCINSFGHFPKGIRQSLDPLDKQVKIEKIRAITFPGLNEEFFDRYLFQSFFGNVHDIALIFLEEETNAQFLQISNSLPIGANFIQLGFGMDFHEPSKDRYPLRMLQNGVAKNLNFERMITVVNKNSSLRDGDSGGPLILKNKDAFTILGILSDADPRPLIEIRDGNANYTDIRYFSDWINDAIHFKVMKNNIHPQYPLEKNILLTAVNIKTTYKTLCSHLSKKYGSKWFLNEEFDCLPNDEFTCNKFSSPIFPVEWDVKSSKCLYR